jgi:hypothetical protein
MNACRASASCSDEKPFHISCRSGPARSPAERSTRPTAPPALNTLFEASSGSTHSDPGSVAARRKIDTSRPRPPLDTSTRRSHISGN